MCIYIYIYTYICIYIYIYIGAKLLHFSGAQKPWMLEVARAASFFCGWLGRIPQWHLQVLLVSSSQTLRLKSAIMFKDIVLNDSLKKVRNRILRPWASPRRCAPCRRCSPGARGGSLGRTSRSSARPPPSSPAGRSGRTSSTRARPAR